MKHYKIKFHLFNSTKVWLGKANDQAEAMEQFTAWISGFIVYTDLVSIKEFKL